MSTISDVARTAGVSVATVSRALRGLDRVSPTTRERVLKVAAELHYVASPTATSLASGRTKVIGVVAPFLSRWFFATLISAIDKALRDRGHHVLLFDLEDDSFDRRMRLSQGMLWKRVDGIITLNIPIDAGELALLDRLGLPLVAIGNPVPGRPCVRIDDARAMRLATEHVIDLGHSDIAYVGAVPSSAAHIQTPQDRLTAFCATLEEHGLTSPAGWVLDSEWTADSAAQDAELLLSSDTRPTAVVAASDEMAIGVMATARRLGLRVPEDLSVVGIDDYLLSRVLGLTTVRQDVAALGRRAGEILMRQLAGQPAPAEGDLLLPTELVVRTSTGVPPQRRPRAKAKAS